MTISLVQAQGQRLRYGANADVLSSPISLESVGGFYAIGGTRIKLLDILVILAIVGGLGVAIGHLTLGWIFKYYGLTRRAAKRRSRRRSWRSAGCRPGSQNAVTTAQQR